MPDKEGSDYKYKNWRSHGEWGLCAKFKYVNGEEAFSERTGNKADHYKLAALDLPRKIASMMAKGDRIPTQSWKALLDFDKELERVRKNLQSMLERNDETRHPTKKIQQLLESGLDETRDAFYAEVKKRKLGRVKKGKLVFDSYEETAARAVAIYQEKLARRAPSEP